MAIVEVAVLHTGWLRVELAAYLCDLMLERRYRIIIGFSQAVPHDHNHNLVVKRFLEREPSADYLLIFGDDSVPKANLLDLVERDLDVVGFPHPLAKWQSSPDEPLQWNVVLGHDDRGRATGGRLDLSQGIVEVEAVGSGAMLIARRVLEHPDLRAPFRFIYNQDGLLKTGEDLNFCYRARAAGFRVYAALSHLCGHVKDVDLGAVYALLERNGHATKSAI